MMPNYLLQNPDDCAGPDVLCVDAARHGQARKTRCARASAAIESSPGDSVMLYNAACLYARLGETRRAIATLRHAIDAGVQQFRVDEATTRTSTALRDDPEFIELTSIA